MARIATMVKGVELMTVEMVAYIDGDDVPGVLWWASGWAFEAA